jgi:hypothetical protein
VSAGPDAANVPGELANHAASILMKVLYGARMGRWDLLKAVASLATHLTKWKPACDKALFRLLCYINCTTSATLTGCIGDAPGELSLRLYADADFAGDKSTHRSTSGAFLALVGPRSFMPLAAKTKKQSCVSHSTPEAEVVSLNLALRTLGMPAMTLWDLVLGRKAGLDVMEDNDATIVIVNSGRNPSLRLVPRTQGVNVAWLHEVFRNPDYRLYYQPTLGQFVTSSPSSLPLRLPGGTHVT